MNVASLEVTLVNMAPADARDPTIKNTSPCKDNRSRDDPVCAEGIIAVAAIRHVLQDLRKSDNTG